METKKLEYLVNSLLPEYIINDYPKYVSFIKEYLKAIEEESGPFEVLNNITKFIDVDVVPEDSITNFVYQYLNSFPVEWLNDIDIREFISNSKSFYAQKGNEAAVRFIFNLIGGELSFYYPSNDLFLANISTLSGDHVIHDNKYYAYYVYEIVTDLDYLVYEDIIREMTHPVGEKVVFRKVVQLTGIADYVFDAQVTHQSQLIEQVIQWYSSVATIEQRYNIIEEHLLNMKKNALPDIIEEYFFSNTGYNIIEYKDLSVYQILNEDPYPTDIGYEIKSTDVIFAASGSTISSVTADLSVFSEDDIIEITGSVSNNSQFTIVGTPTTDTITVIEAVTDDSTANEVHIIQL